MSALAGPCDYVSSAYKIGLIIGREIFANLEVRTKADDFVLLIEDVITQPM